MLERRKVPWGAQLESLGAYATWSCFAGSTLWAVIVKVFEGAPSEPGQETDRATQPDERQST
jgi:uncharacterized membrane protein